LVLTKFFGPSHNFGLATLLVRSGSLVGKDRVALGVKSHHRNKKLLHLNAEHLRSFVRKQNFRSKTFWRSTFRIEDLQYCVMNSSIAVLIIDSITLA